MSIVMRICRAASILCAVIYVDNSQEFRSIELCAGYAGISLGLKRVIQNLRTVAYVEIESFACANLVAKMEAGHLDAAPIWTDLKTFNAEPFRDRIHIITGGYPCQPFSTAGKRQGKNDPRHLWPYIREIVKTVRPVFCFFENVEGHLSLGYKEVQQSLRTLGYTVEGGIFSAAEVGAPQQRKRLFILAHDQSQCSRLYQAEWERGEVVGRGSPEVDELADRDGGEPGQITRDFGQMCGFSAEECEPENGSSLSRRSCSVWPSRPGQPQHEWEPPRVVGDTKNDHRGAGKRQKKTGTRPDGIRRGRSSEPSKRKIKSSLGRAINGITDRLDNAKLYQSCDNRTDELRLLGNGVVPDTAEKAFVVLFNKIMDGINAAT